MNDHPIYVDLVGLNNAFTEYDELLIHFADYRNKHLSP